VQKKLSTISTILSGICCGNGAKGDIQTKERNGLSKKYWKTMETRKWVFMEENSRLYNAGDTPIVRHISLKLDKHPTWIETTLKLENLNNAAREKLRTYEQELPTDLWGYRMLERYDIERVTYRS